jgi:hypothetical protein
VFDVMRARFQAQRGVAYAFLGSEEGILEELFSEKVARSTDSPSHRPGRRRGQSLRHRSGRLAGVPAGEIRGAQDPIDDASVDRLLDATGGHPQDTMQLCAALYYLMRDAGQRVVTADHVAVAYEQALRELERPFALHWSELGTQKYLQQVAKRIAHGAVLYAADSGVPRPEVLRALESLRARGLVARLGRGRYEFVEPMFGNTCGEWTRLLPVSFLADGFSGLRPGATVQYSPAHSNEWREGEAHQVLAQPRGMACGESFRALLVTREPAAAAVDEPQPDSRRLGDSRSLATHGAPDQENDDRPDDRADQAGRCDVERAAEEQRGERSTDERADDAEDHRAEASPSGPDRAPVARAMNPAIRPTMRKTIKPMCFTSAP